MKNKILSIISFLAFSAVLVVNYLANALPINGLDTGVISDFYPNLFTPAGITFSIWGLIYLSLILFTLFQLGLFGKNRSEEKKNFYGRVNLFFILSSFANISWIFAWHYLYVGISLVFMILILANLIRINDIIKTEDLNLTEKLFVKFPFSIYFGWITVATVANVTALLVSLQWSGFGIPESTWAVLILIVAAVIGIVRGVLDKNIAYLCVFIWAYLGIFYKHISIEGFGGSYPIILNAISVCIIFYVIAIIKLSLRKHKV